MIVWVDDALFAGPHRDLDRLALLRNAARRRHTLLISRSPGEVRCARATPTFDHWLTTLPDRLRKEIGLVRERLDIVSVMATTQGAPRVLVCEQDPGAAHRGSRLNLQDAVRALSLPLHLLIEHQIHDAAFLRRALPPVWRDRFAQWERRGELRYENGGGLAVMRALVEFHCDNDNARRAFGLPAEIWRLLHFIVIDHDGDSADIPGDHSGALGRACDRLGMQNRFHRLERRDQEHYLPIPALRQIIHERITDPTYRERLLEGISAHQAKGLERHFAPLPSLGDESYFKNAFMKTDQDWPDHWFEDDGVWPEMTRLAERIASSM